MNSTNQKTRFGQQRADLELDKYRLAVDIDALLFIEKMIAKQSLILYLKINEKTLKNLYQERNSSEIKFIMLLELNEFSYEYTAHVKLFN